MRPIVRKIYKKINDKGIDFYKILEIVDKTSTQEMKKSFPDDCHFQTDKYFAKTILKEMLQHRLIYQEGNKYFKMSKKKKEKNKEDEK